MTAMKWRRWVKAFSILFLCLKLLGFCVVREFFFQLKIALYTSYRLEVIMIVHNNWFLGK